MDLDGDGDATLLVQEKLKRQALVSDLVRSYWSVPPIIELRHPGSQPH